MSLWADPGTSNWLLGGYLGLLSIVWVALILGTRTWGNKWRLARLDVERELGTASDLMVSVCIPARNEASNIEGCVRAALASRWPGLEVIVVDDRSDDETAIMAAKGGEGDDRLHVFSGVEPPTGWAGKPWACARAAGEARGQILCFIDADVRISPDTIPALVAEMATKNIRLLSVYGSWTLVGFWERLLIPAVGWLIRGAVDLDIINDPGRPEAFANGQLIMVERQAYETVGAHGSVRDQILEDVRLAEQFKTRGFVVQMRVAPWAFSVRLYDDLSSIVRGYAKNLFEGMGRRPSIAFGAIVFIFVGALLPWMALGFALFFRFAWDWQVPGTGWVLWVAAICISQIAFRWCLEVRDGRSGRIAWLHPLANILLVWILFRSMTSMTAEWKGRTFIDGRAQ